MNKEWARFYALRRRVFDAIDHIVNDPEDDGCHKSYEGAMDVRLCFDNYFNAKDVTDVAFVEIELHCYLLINGRHMTWSGKTFKEALDNAEEGIELLLQQNGVPTKPTREYYV